MNNKLITYGITFFGFLAVAYPLWVRVSSLQWAFNVTLLLNNFFPLFGITAFTLLWLHAMSGMFEPWLRQHINFDRFVSITATMILICILAHPLLLLALFNFDVLGILTSYGTLYVLLGVMGWLLLLTYDITKLLKGYHDFFVRHWKNVLIISNVGFLITFFHSLYLGSDLQGGPLRMIWIFYGITAMVAIVYTYAIKKHPA